MIDDGARKDEIEIWRHGWKFNYLIGQLNYVAEKYGKKFEAYIENKYYFNQLQKQKRSGVTLINKKISARLISQLLKDGKVIVYLDIFNLENILHAPHFVLALGQDKNSLKIADPSSGKVRKIPIRTITKGIDSLKGHLKYSPVLVTLHLAGKRK